MPLLIVVTGLPGTGKSTVAEAIARMLHGSTISHDWVMSGLRPYQDIQGVLDQMTPSGHRVVGWSILTALARAQLRQGQVVVLDGVARAEEIAKCKELALSEAARMSLVATKCSDRALHERRIEGRQRQIPSWYELTWGRVERSIATWEEPVNADLVLDAANDWADNLSQLERRFAVRR
jgi:hypothetical protein